MTAWAKLVRAVDHGDAQEVARLLKEGGPLRLSLKTKQWGNTALHRAAAKGNAEILQMLLNAGAKPSAANENGWTPLHDAAFNGHTECVELLTAHGADIAAKTKDGMSAIVVAKARGHDWLVKVALSQGLVRKDSMHHGAKPSAMIDDDVFANRPSRTPRDPSFKVNPATRVSNGSRASRSSRTSRKSVPLPTLNLELEATEEKRSSRGFKGHRLS
eukprot:m.169169 g.169169  ORF g.169169 m.169169 type:complete len:216 (-) comp13065_c0_seq1:236-883(-)